MHQAARNKSTGFVIMITISVNTRGSGALLTKYTYDKYIYIYFIIAFIHIFA